MAVLCSGREGKCENEAKIRGYCKSCMRYMQRYGAEQRELPPGVVIISEVEHRIGSHGLVYRKAATGGWIRSTKSVDDFIKAQRPKKKRKKA